MSGWSRKKTVVALLGLLAAPVVAWALVPYAGGCALRGVVGLPCPGCGLGHAALALGALELGAAVASYPPIVPIVALYLLGVIALLSHAVYRRASRLCGSGATWVGGASVVTLIAHWIFRLSSARGG